jgi:hypothetical protein
MALLIDAEGGVQLFRADLSNGMTERWLQETLFSHPFLIPLDQIDPSAGSFLPICREFSLPKLGGSVFIDLLGVTAGGKIVIVECKLWRNPQARREVVAQVIEYAALLRKWSYADLTARLKAVLQIEGSNPLFEHVRRQGGQYSETVFTDSVARSLRTGDFYLLVAGDGIREDMQAIAEHLNQQGSRIALIEFQHWTDQRGRSLLVPSIPFRTEVIRQRILTDATGEPLRTTEDDETGNDIVGDDGDPDRARRLAENRAFWQTFIDTVRFDHPDQSPPRHGGNNWVKIPLPEPARWLTAYRNGNDTGLFLVANKESDIFVRLAEEIEAIRDETGIAEIRVAERRGGVGDPDRLAIRVDESTLPTPEAQMAWLIENSNKLVTVLRERLGSLS